jgi:hypothetical protein
LMRRTRLPWRRPWPRMEQRWHHKRAAEARRPTKAVATVAVTMTWVRCTKITASVGPAAAAATIVR